MTREVIMGSLEFLKRNRVPYLVIHYKEKYDSGFEIFQSLKQVGYKFWKTSFNGKEYEDENDFANRQEEYIYLTLK